MIAVIDYGAGNMRSVVNAFEAIGHKPLVTKERKDLKRASAIVLPGVGAFGDGIGVLRKLGFIEELNEQILVKKKPYLGICLGLQFLARESYEHGCHKGFGWIEGVVRKIIPEDNRYRIPHIGWNDIKLERPSPLFNGIDQNPVYYFVHSYHLEVEDSLSDLITSTCWHGQRITASIEKENIYAVQFHPEKSQRNGLRLLENFTKLIS